MKRALVEGADLASIPWHEFDTRERVRACPPVQHQQARRRPVGERLLSDQVPRQMVIEAAEVLEVRRAAVISLVPGSGIRQAICLARQGPCVQLSSML